MQPGTQSGSRAPRDDAYPAAGRQDGPRAVVPKPVRRARIGLLLLLAFMTEVIVIAAAGNQAVTDGLVDASRRSVKGGLEETLETFAWRISARPHDYFHVWAGGLALIGATVVLSLLLILVVVRGPVTFGRAFFGTWMSVAVATMLGGYVRGLVIDTPNLSRHGKLARSLFSTIAPGSTTFLAGVALGLIVALVVGTFAMITRKPAETTIVGPADDDYPDFYDDNRYTDGDPGYGEQRYGDPGYGTTPYGGAGGGYGTTAGYGAGAAAGYGGEQYAAPETSRGYGTTAVPTRGGAAWQQPSGDSSDTTALPRAGASSREPVRDAGPAVGDTVRDSDATQAVPAHVDPADAAPAHKDPADAAPTHADAADTAPSHDAATQALPTEAAAQGAGAAEPRGVTGAADPTGDAAGERAGDPPGAQETMQFPRPPDDEDIDPEHR